MARAKRTSSVLETARQRLAGLKQITPAPDFGPDLKLADYETEINDATTELDGYNGIIAAADDAQNKFEATEGKLRARSARFLTATEARYGPDSSEYELAGGTRSSERKRPVRKPAGGGTPPTP